jgi:hypothetical protein
LAGSSGKEVKQQLRNVRQACLDDGIPVDDLSSAEYLYYIYQRLSLFPERPILGVLEQQPPGVKTTI